MHYQTQYSKLASATKDFDFFFPVLWLVLSHFITICVADKFSRGCVEPNVVVVHLQD